MSTTRNHGNSILRNGPRAVAVGLALAILFALTVVATQTAQAQTYTVLHSFTGGGDGGVPYAGLTVGGSGTLYGTTEAGGSGGYGTIFKLAYRGSGWTVNPIQSFYVREIGQPWAPVTIGPDGSLSGTLNAYDDGEFTCGGVFTGLTPGFRIPASLLAPWPAPSGEYRFQEERGPCTPYSGVIFDAARNIYGTAVDFGGSTAIAYELTFSNGHWTENDLASFPGLIPSGLIFDHAGNLYGTSDYGGQNGYGMVYELTPSGSGWTLNTLYSFQDGSDGEHPLAGLILDDSGNLYGTTSAGGSGNGGTVYELTPNPDGTWTFNLLQSNAGGWSSLIMDASHNLYGTGGRGMYGHGAVFELRRSGGGWTYVSLHDFCAGGYPCSDGDQSLGSLVLSGNSLWGTTIHGGTYDYGVIFEITP